MTSNNKSRLILSDWAANGKAIPINRKRLLEQILLLSLIYDEILIQDEVLALNIRLAEQFGHFKRFGVIEQLIETGALVFLTHPLYLYPDTEMRERATIEPIHARANYIAKHGTSGDRKFSPTAKQLNFYTFLDSCIAKHPGSRRPVSSETFGGRDVMQVFALLLHLVLDNHKDYGKWVRTAFQGITKDMRTEFLFCIESPYRAIERIRRYRNEAKAISRTDGIPVFNRSLAYQLAATFSAREAKAMQGLIQTIFAAPFCFREKAVGRYSRHLREFLLIPSKADLPSVPSDRHVAIIADVATNLHLPSTDQRFCDAVQAVRGGRTGKDLRAVMRRIGKDREFKRLEYCWQAVAEELASHYYNNPPVSIRHILGTLCGAVASATIALSGDTYFNQDTLESMTDDVIYQILWSLFGQGVLLSGDLFLKSLQHDLKYQQLRRHIEKALCVRCSDISIPQALVGT